MTTILGSDSAHLVGSMNWEPFRKRLLVSDLQDALAAVTELRQSEVVHSSSEGFSLMLSALLPSLSSILTSRTKVSADPTSIDHRLRNAVLDFMSKFPPNDTLRPHAPHLVAVALNVLTRDYEDNALLASRIIFDLYKVYRNLPQDHVQPFLDFVLAAYRNVPNSVGANFSYTTLTATLPLSSSSTTAVSKTSAAAEKSSGAPSEEGQQKKTEQKPKTESSSSQAKSDPKSAASMQSRSSSASMASDSSSGAPKRLALKSNASFRVLTECPLIMMVRSLSSHEHLSLKSTRSILFSFSFFSNFSADSSRLTSRL